MIRRLLCGKPSLALVVLVFACSLLRALIATQPDAKQATDAAVAFGQDDDITVITFARLAPGVESTTSLLAPALVSSDAWFSRGSNQP